MAIFKYVNKKYLCSSDLSNLIYYITKPQKAWMVYSNMLYYEDVSLVLTQWMYHHIYHHKPTDLVYHYILSFQPCYDLPSSCSFLLMRIMQDIANMECFRNINLLMGVHKETSASPYHIHIAADTINKVTGKHLFIDYHDLINSLGKILESYNIPLIGYQPAPNAARYTPIQFISFAS